MLETPTATAPPRLGPRPLPLHLGTALATWSSSLAGLPSLNAGSPSWSPGAAAATALARDLDGAAPEAFAAALEREVRHRLDRLLAGIEAYRRHPYRRALDEPPVVWQAGTTRLLDYGTGAAGRPLLVVPSLVNRAYVLDLAPGCSLLRYLAGRGLRPLLVDWGAPAAEERGFDLDGYITGRLAGALAAAHEATGARPLILGYCMGGLLALALASHRPGEVAGLALLATPWDFHADSPALARGLAAGLVPHWPWIERLGEMPVDLVQTLFAALDPWLVVRKFTAFADLDPGSAAAESFVALEDWLNDGVPLAAPMAREAIVGWYGENRPARGAWAVAGRPVRPAALALPALAVIPAHDRIVPPASAAALAAAIPGAAVMRPALGHIGMIVGRGARRGLWPRLARWLRQAGP